MKDTKEPCRWRFILALAMSLCIPFAAGAQARPAPTRVEVAEGVHVFRSVGWGDVGNEGNAVLVVGDSAALVFDTNGTPVAAEAVLAEIRKVTDRPVRWIVNSHWHWDHWYGTEVYRRAFPDVTVVAHEKTRALMQGPAIEFNRPGLEVQLPGFISMLEQRVAEGASIDPPPADLSRIRETLGLARPYLEQKRSVRLVLPDVTFEERLDIDLGGRTVQVLNRGRAVTPGDAFLWVPDERILVLGDLLIDPVTYALSVYPTEWLHTMEYLDSLDATVLVPGHGAPMRDEEHLHATMDAMRFLLREGKAAEQRGLDVEATKAELLPRMRGITSRITDDDAQVNAQFENLFVDWYLHRVWEELDGPLTDAIAPIPLH